ncbi:MAG: Methylamine utilization protein MauE [Acidimicrobiaceae bacterium]|jgi:hypothetical protein|nr:Methylamine utilization protein MauE [Acidimicrobiaceae bacterium]
MNGVIGLLGSAAAPVLAALLAWAGAATLTHRRRVVAVLAGLHVPVPPLMAVVVPLLEVAIAGVLLVHPADGAAAALVLLAASHVALTWWAGGGRPCPRVGSARLDPVSWADVGRNLGLAALGVCALFGGSAMAAPSLPALVAVTTTVLLGMVLLAAAELFGRLHSRAEGVAH